MKASHEDGLFFCTAMSASVIAKTVDIEMRMKLWTNRSMQKSSHLVTAYAHTHTPRRRCIHICTYLPRTLVVSNSCVSIISCSLLVSSISIFLQVHMYMYMYIVNVLFMYHRCISTEYEVRGTSYKYICTRYLYMCIPGSTQYTGLCTSMHVACIDETTRPRVEWWGLI